MPRLSRFFRSSSLALAASLAAVVSARPASADVTLTSSDGRWVAVIEDFGGAAGQCNGLRDTDAAALYEPFLANTRHYIRMGNSISYLSATSQRMENIFRMLSFASSGDTYTATLACDNVTGLIAIVHGEMVAGNAGGLRVSLSFADTNAEEPVLSQWNVKPFVYANMNVDGEIISNVGGWATDYYYQSANNTGTGNTRWFRGRDLTSHASTHDSLMQDALDTGVIDLSNVSWLGPGDINCAMGFAGNALGPSETHTIAYAVGNAGISIPVGFGLPPNAGTVGLNSADGDWGASIRTGLGDVGFGSAGEVNGVFDFNLALPSMQFAKKASYYLAANVGTSLIAQPVKETFSRLAFFYPTENVSMVSTVLNSRTLPGLILIIDAKMISGANGGLVVSMKYADTVNRSLHIAPLVFADLDCDNQVTDTGGFDEDHFYQHGPGLSPYRWFKTPAGSFSSRMSGLSASVEGLLNAGLTVLNNNVWPGPGNIAAAFAFHPWALQADGVYATGYALGDAGIDIPVNFVHPTVWTACPADIAPLPQGDNQVDVDDLLAVISVWGACATPGPECAGDVVPHYLGDGLINVDDLLEVITNWGACFPK